MLNTAAKAITRILLAIGASVLAMMMFLTAMDVALRYVFNRPLAGAFELVEYMMAIFIPFSIVYCADQKAHVSVDFILMRFSKRTQKAFDIATTFITMALAVLIAWENIIYIVETYQSKMTSPVLSIPAYPFVAPTAIGIGAFALVLAAQWLQLFGVREQQ
ncbi:MAG: TRAP transporter small permease [Desulfosarcinaceae bacterium]